MKLYYYVEQLAKKIQESWELSELLFHRHWADNAPSEVTRRNHRNILNYMHEGLHDFRRNYRVDEKDGNYRVIYDCNYTGMRKIHCVVNKDTGDVAKYDTELINEPSFQYNLVDSRSRESCLAIADYKKEYLK